MSRKYGYFLSIFNKHLNNLPLVLADPVASNLKEYNEKLTQAKHALSEAKTLLSSDYIQNFATILEGGVNKLNVRVHINRKKCSFFPFFIKNFNIGIDTGPVENNYRCNQTARSDHLCSQGFHPFN